MFRDKSDSIRESKMRTGLPSFPVKDTKRNCLSPRLNHFTLLLSWVKVGFHSIQAEAMLSLLKTTVFNTPFDISSFLLEI